MAYPPPVPPATRTDATVMATNHPSDHNLISAALTEILNHMATMENALYPIGVMSMWGGDTAPGNHAFCRGQEAVRADNPEVFSIYGTKFGTGNGSTTFNLPNFCSRVPFGLWPGGPWGTVLGQIIGNAASSVPTHRHNMPHEHGVNLWSSYQDLNHYHVVPTGGRGFVVDGGGNNGSAGVAIDPPYAYAFQTNVGYAEPNDGRMNHRHATNGQTDGGNGFTTQDAGGDPTSTNLQPSIVVNFIMRMH